MDMRRDDNWNDCPRGEIGGLVSRLKGNTRRRQLRVTGLVAAVVVSAGGLLLALFPGSGQVPAKPGAGNLLHGGIACPDVVPQLEGYARGTLQEPLRDSIERHLVECPQCRERLARVRQRLEDAPATATIDAEWPRTLAHQRPARPTSLTYAAFTRR